MKKAVWLCTMLAVLCMGAYASEKLDLSAVGSNAAGDAVLSVSPEAMAKAAYENWLLTGTASAYEKGLMEQFIFAADRAAEYPLDAQGGPDAYGYRWVDNVSPDTVVYGWIELCNDPTASVGPSGDDAAMLINLGLTFPYYGVNYTTAYVSTNGVLQFGSANSAYFNSCISATNTNNAIYIYWDDMIANAGTPGTCTNGVIYFKNFGNYTVIQYRLLDPFSGTGFTSVEAILWTNGRVKIQWHASEYTHSSTSATVACEAAGANGIQYICNTAGIVGGRAVVFYPPVTDPTGRCCYGDPVAPSCVVNTSSQCAALGGTWSIGLDCSTPCPSCVDFTLTAPGNVSGNTTGAGDNCNLRVGAEQIVAVTIPVSGAWTFSLCGGSTWDTYLYLTSACCAGTILASNDDYCGLQSEINCFQLAAGTYYVDIEPYSSGSGGAWTLNVTRCQPPVGRCCYGDPGTPPQCADVTQEECASLGGTWTAGANCAANPCPVPCVVECPSGATQEGEICPNNPDTFNGGCNSVPPVFSPIACGATVCGTAYALTGTRDTDWYELVLTEEDSVTWSVIAEYPVMVAIITPGVPVPCTGFTFVYATGQPCQVTSVAACLQPGTYWLFTAPSVFNEVPCGDYVGVVSCQPCAQPFVCRCETQPNTHCDFTGGAIADYTWLEVPVVVPIEYHITDLNVCLDITHTWDGDLQIFIRSPLGTEVELSTNNGGSGDNYTCTTFDDEATTAVTAGTAPFTGSFIPEGSLADFDGENAVGTWLIRIYDAAGGDVGTLNWFCLTFEYDEILPVELLGDLVATASDRAVTLSWATASEVNNDRFEILRDGRLVGTKAGAGTSSDRHNYAWTESNLDNGVTYTYTLVSVDVNGTRNELATASATPSFTAATITEYALHQNFPNPFNPVTSIAFDLVESGFVSLKVYNLMGQEVANVVSAEMGAGRHIVNFDASNLSSGVYLYTIESGKFSASRKMLLMK